MITPIKTMTINQIMERKDDVLISDEDIKEMARNVRAKAIDEFATYMSDYIYENQYGCVDDLLDRPYTTMLEIAEQMKAGGIDE